MGYAKDRLIRGLSFVDGSVCADCLDDRGLADLVESVASEPRCDFCGKESESKPIAAHVNTVVDYMDECISREYEDPANSVGWCSEEGGWLGVRVLHTDELLAEELGLELPNDSDGNLLEALCAASSLGACVLVVDGLGDELVDREGLGPAGPGIGSQASLFEIAS